MISLPDVHVFLNAQRFTVRKKREELCWLVACGDQPAEFFSLFAATDGR